MTRPIHLMEPRGACPDRSTLPPPLIEPFSNRENGNDVRLHLLCIQSRTPVMPQPLFLELTWHLRYCRSRKDEYLDLPLLRISTAVKLPGSTWKSQRRAHHWHVRYCGSLLASERIRRGAAQCAIIPSCHALPGFPQSFRL